MELLETVRIAILGLLAIYSLLWAVPGVIFGAVLALGDPQRIVWLDKQLAKNVDALHANYQNMMSYNIMSRFMCYCLSYPFIRSRATTNSTKFKIFMWANSLGFWCWVGAFFYAMLAKLI